MKLEKGIYENLIDSKLAADIKVSEENGLICSKDAMVLRNRQGCLQNILRRQSEENWMTAKSRWRIKKIWLMQSLIRKSLLATNLRLSRPIFLRKSWTGGKRQSVKLSRGRRFGRARVSVSAIFSREGNRLYNLDMRLSETLHPPTEYALLCRFLDCRV